MLCILKRYSLVFCLVLCGTTASFAEHAGLQGYEEDEGIKAVKVFKKQGTLAVRKKDLDEVKRARLLDAVRERMQTRHESYLLECFFKAFRNSAKSLLNLSYENSLLSSPTGINVLANQG